MIRRSKNQCKMTGRKHELVPSSKGGRMLCPWADLAVGDWFEPGADSYIMAHKRTKLDNGREYVGVQVTEVDLITTNCVVRVK
jgi:hypothetical protein